MFKSAKHSLKFLFLPHSRKNSKEEQDLNYPSWVHLTYLLNQLIPEKPFEHKSFKLKSSLNHVATYQLESVFSLIEDNTHT